MFASLSAKYLTLALCHAMVRSSDDNPRHLILSVLSSSNSPSESSPPFGHLVQLEEDLACHQ